MQCQTPSSIHARLALTRTGWQRDVRIDLAADGTITAIASHQPATTAHDLVLCGMANVHSHAFQRAMVGLTEHASGHRHDTFWSWREVMYHFLGALTPEQVEIIARAFYIELLKAGYTAVGEFHYLHHAADGTPYDNPAELSDRIIAASQQSGMALTLLPVLYQTGNFGNQPATKGQHRFLHTTDAYLRLLETLRSRPVALGVAPHSLRAVTPESLQQVIAALPSLGLGQCPIHIHAAEQEKEVADCLAWSGQRPAQWLMNHHAVDARWCLIHATHLSDEEVDRLAASGAVAGLCPTTEGNLGDGIFPAQRYLAVGGTIGIGTDSHVCLNPWEELRQLEYGQRLSLRQRNVLHGEHHSIGRSLFERATQGGAQALALHSGQLATGYRADLVAYRLDHWLFAGKTEDTLLDTLLLCQHPPVTDVWIAGRQVITSGHHPHEAEAMTALATVMKQLLA